MKFSGRTDWDTTENKLFQTLASLREQRKEILDLTQSNPTLAAFKYLTADLLKPLADVRSLVYEPDPKGLLRAREAVCGYYSRRGIKVEPPQVFLTSSTSEGYFYLFRMLADPGNAVFVPTPGYPLFDYLCGLSDVTSEKYPLLEQAGAWRMDTQFLEGADVSKGRALITVNPNNPTGNYTTAEEAAWLNRFCGSRQLALISDEVFWDYPFYPGAKRFSFAGNQESLSFTLSGISKILGLPQMKLSWIVVSGPETLREEAIRRLEIVFDTVLPASAPVQHALPSWLAASPSPGDEILARIRSNLQFAERSLSYRRFSFQSPEGGWYLLLRLPPPLVDDEFALELLKEEGVYTHPGFLFDFSEGEKLVLSLLPQEGVFKEGFSRILKRMS